MLVRVFPSLSSFMTAAHVLGRRATRSQHLLSWRLMCPFQGLPGCLPWGMFLTFFNDFLSQQKGLSVPVATMVRV